MNFGNLLGGGGFMMTPKETADIVLMDIVNARRDFTNLIDHMVTGYHATFDHDSMLPLNDRDKNVREFIEQCLWGNAQNHKAHHEGCMDDIESTYDEFVEAWRRRAFDNVRSTWIEANKKPEDGGDDAGDFASLG